MPISAFAHSIFDYYIVLINPLALLRSFSTTQLNKAGLLKCSLATSLVGPYLVCSPVVPHPQLDDQPRRAGEQTNACLLARRTQKYAFLTPDLWCDIPLSKFSYDEHSAHLQLAQVMGIYLLSTLIQLRNSFPPPPTHPATEPDVGIVNLFSTLPEYQLFGSLFDGASFLGRWGALVWREAYSTLSLSNGGSGG
ncbi:hypothetical protein L227DRAFT_567565 [Lentinus tigrinus ALCF2SS1-6]|uniref:Abscisic acid G-protein coupled receptor-like domain-containing protein n=1 Tax=Lentinus tigrinus ALCF2SS1-6 TaxID=1328759 RepID=A0A5C2RR01_9APHY|nr:hypothetical protein L227DRAFT_567565 [Lentinus tigrinus ALCF2SS1-6]